jgi:chromosome segregation ATPase
MARAGIGRFDVQQARDAILARGAKPTIDAVRIELGNTGSKTTIQRYLRELSEEEGARLDDEALLSATLREIVGRLANQLRGEAEQLIQAADARHQEALNATENEKRQVDQALSEAQQGIETLTAKLEAADANRSALGAALTEAEAQIREKDQAIADLHARLADKDERIASLEDKHRHARESLTHYRQSVKEQREQDIRQHEEQLRQLQQEVRQLGQVVVGKQNEISQLAQEAARLAAEQAACQRRVREQDTSLEKSAYRVQTLIDEREQWQMMQARLEERSASAEATRTRAEKLAADSAAALAECRTSDEAKRVRIEMLQAQVARLDAQLALLQRLRDTEQKADSEGSE